MSNFIPTLNGMGFATSSIDDPYTEKFIKFAVEVGAPVLEVGAAFGVASIEAARKGARVIINDLDERHLKKAEERIEGDLRNRIIFEPGSFPRGLNFKENSLGATLIVRVIHFFSGSEIEESVKALFKWLKPGGRVFMVAETPFLGNFQKLVPVFESRKKSGDLWPGWVRTKDYEAAGFSDNLPEMMHFMDRDILSRAFESEGFEIIECDFFPRPNFPKEIQLDGRESVGIVAQKPIQD